MAAHPHTWSERETPALLQAADFSWMPRDVRELGSAVPRLFGELFERGAATHDVRVSVTELAHNLNLNRKTIRTAATVLSARGFLLRDTSRRPQIWRLRMRPREGA